MTSALFLLFPSKRITEKRLELNEHLLWIERIGTRFRSITLLVFFLEFFFSSLKMIDLVTYLTDAFVTCFPLGSL